MPVNAPAHMPMRALLETLQRGILAEHPTLPRHFLKQKTQLTQKKQINIYALAYKYRLLGILEEDYPLLRKRLGKRKFLALAKDFIAEHPPETSSLAQYSRNFADALKQKHNQLPPDILLLVAREAAELDLLEMESLPPFQATADTTPEQLLALHLIPQPASVILKDSIIYRIGDRILEHPLSPQEAKALQQLAKAPSLEQWIAKLPTSSAVQVPQWLSSWLANFLLCQPKP